MLSHEFSLIQICGDSYETRCYHTAITEEVNVLPIFSE